MARFYTNTVLMPTEWEQRKNDMEVLMQAKACWDSRERFRRKRERIKRYVFGDQWGDKINYGNSTITEEEYIKSEGNIPLKNNVLGKMIRTAQGVYDEQDRDLICVANDPDEQQLNDIMTVALQVNNRRNSMERLNSVGFLEFLVSAVVIMKETFGYRENKRDAWTDLISPNMFFWRGAGMDLRNKDLDMVGEIHDMTFGQVCSTFARNEKEYRKLGQIYNIARNKEYLNSVMTDLGRHSIKDYDFLYSKEPSICRVIEVWTKEQKPRFRCIDPASGDIYKIDEEDRPLVDAENKRRREAGMAQGMTEEQMKLIRIEWFVDDYWYYRFFTPFGDVLDEGETPYDHKSHPYIMRIYPMLDGEAHSLAESGIDQQRYINRLLVLQDFIIRASAKGLLMIPEDSLGDYTPEQFAEQWVRPNGYIVYRPSKSGQMPQQISANSTNVGIGDLLNVQLKLMEDVTGINGAIQGKEGFSGMSAALYQQQQHNAGTTLLDIVESYNAFTVDVAEKKVRNIQQFYEGKRMLSVVGKNAVVWYDAKKMLRPEFDISIVQGNSTPAARYYSNDVLLKLWETGAISVEQLLEEARFPFSESLLQSIKNQRSQMEEGMAPQGIAPQMMQQARQTASPEFMKMLDSMSMDNAPEGVQNPI